MQPADLTAVELGVALDVAGQRVGPPFLLGSLVDELPVTGVLLPTAHEHRGIFATPARPSRNPARRASCLGKARKRGPRFGSRTGPRTEEHALRAGDGSPKPSSPSQSPAAKSAHWTKPKGHAVASLDSSEPSLTVA